jgi:hypothetical protein
VIGKVKTSSAAIAIFGWWVVFMLVVTGLVAAFT